MWKWVKMIRFATPSNIDGIVALIQPYIIDFAISTEGEEKFNRTMIEKLLEMPSMQYFVFEKNAQLIGVIAYRQPAHLIHFFVHQNFQRQGVGKKMWQFVENKIKENSSNVTVNSSCYAQAIYEKFGFTTISSVIENGGLRYIPMQKSDL